MVNMDSNVVDNDGQCRSRRIEQFFSKNVM
jgi:hypothetical protein